MSALGMSLPRLRKRIAWELGYLADRLAPEEGFRLLTGLSVTCEEGRGWVLRSDHQGTPIWYRGDADYDRAHNEAAGPTQGGDAVSAERRRVVGELRDFADDLYGITGARWIADALTSTLDRLSEDDK